MRERDSPGGVSHLIAMNRNPLTVAKKKKKRRERNPKNRTFKTSKKKKGTIGRQKFLRVIGTLGHSEKEVTSPTSSLQHLTTSSKVLQFSLNLS